MFTEMFPSLSAWTNTLLFITALFDCFVPIRQKLLYALIRQRMFDELLQYFIWDRCNMGSVQCRIDDMHRMTNGGSNNFRVNAMAVKNFRDRCNQIHSVMANVIEPS